MTEQDFLSSTDQGRMLREPLDIPGDQILERRLSPRKLRLFACAISRRAPPPSRLAALAADAAECMADGLPFTPVAEPISWHVLHEDASEAARLMVEYVEELRDAERRPSGAEMAAMLRDIAGNPWRPVSLCGNPDHGSVTVRPHCPACRRLRTPAVLDLARAAYGERGGGAPIFSGPPPG